MHTGVSCAKRYMAWPAVNGPANSLAETGGGEGRGKRKQLTLIQFRIRRVSFQNMLREC